MARCFALMLVALAGVGGCDSSPESEAMGCRPEGGFEPEHKVVKCVVDGRCVGMEAHPSCPTSPDDPQALCTRFGVGHRVTRVACGPHVVVWWSGGTQGFACLYDGAGKLIGTYSVIDSPTYCGRFGTWTWGANVPQECIQSSDPSLCGA